MKSQVLKTNKLEHKVASGYGNKAAPRSFQCGGKGQGQIQSMREGMLRLSSPQSLEVGQSQGPLGYLWEEEGYKETSQGSE